jgi:hypothetical protein
MKKFFMKEIKYIIFCLVPVPVPTFEQVTVPVPVPLVKKCSTTLAEWEMRLSREGDEIYPSG